MLIPSVQGRYFGVAASNLPVDGVYVGSLHPGHQLLGKVVVDRAISPQPLFGPEWQEARGAVHIVQIVGVA